jgi:hypothetical protein
MPQETSDSFFSEDELMNCSLTGNRSSKCKENGPRPPLDAIKLGAVFSIMKEKDVTSTHKWASAPVLVRKKDGSVRWCVDYRKLNELTVKQNWPVPSFSQCADLLHDLKFMSTVDMASGYWQIEVAEDDKEKTAFITKHGLFQYLRMPFGLKNAPTTFMRAVSLVLQGLQWQDVLTYLDNIFIMGKNFEHQLSVECVGAFSGV